MVHVYRPPTSNVDKLEGAVTHLFSICGVLTDTVVDAFVQRYAAQRKKRLPPKYGTKVLIPRMRNKHIIFEVSYHRFSLNPIYAKRTKGLDACWVFLENMDGVDLNTVQKPAGLGDICYIKNNRVYTIVRCDGNGEKELAVASQREIVAEQYTKRTNRKTVEERFFFIFSSQEEMLAAPISLKSPTVFVTIQYEGSRTPTLRFVDPASLHHSAEDTL